MRLYSPLTQERLRELLRYDADSGDFFWRVDPGARIRAGALAGCIVGEGHCRRIRIRINGVAYYAHRLAWLYQTGGWPESEIDHKDINPMNNSWDNLREANRSQNRANMSAFITNKVGIKGITQRRSKFAVHIKYEGKSRHLGTFATLSEATNAYRIAAECVWGEYARQF